MARTKQTARLTTGPRVFGTEKSIDKIIEDLEHASIEELLEPLFEKEVLDNILKTFKYSFVTETKQLFHFSEMDYSSIGIPLGLRMKIVTRISDYKMELIKSKNKLDDNQYFFATEPTEEALRRDETALPTITLLSQPLINLLQQYLPLEELYQSKPTLPVDAFLRAIPSLQTHSGYLPEDDETNKLIKEEINKKLTLAQNGGGFGFNNIHANTTEFQEFTPEHHLLRYLYTHFKRIINVIKKRIEMGKITFSTLFLIFYKGVKVARPGQLFNTVLEGYELMNTNYTSGLFPLFVMTSKQVVSNGAFFRIDQTSSFSIEKFEGAKAIKSLETVPIEEGDEIFKKLEKRGKIYAKLGLGNHYRDYKGLMTRERSYSKIQEDATGRVMVDITAYNKMNNKGSSNQFNNLSIQQALNNQMNVFEKLPESNYWMTPAHITGFSFLNKKWGNLEIEKLEPLTYNTKAFDLLVLEQHKKDVIEALVKHSDKAFSDFIEHKGKGCIFLLHGPPGVGKTLTAEAIAEFLNRPLYAISVGELGTEPTELEANLSEILELAGIWNAVVLVDEADIFLERRSETDIVRNAMVGVFLRVVEYFNGVLFLTSNRVTSLDRAFHSRVSVALKYPELNASSRMKIWDHFINTCSLKVDSTMNLEKLSKYELNGRQIRSTVRLACSLALREASHKMKDGNDSEPVLSLKHITSCVSISNQFSDFIASASLMNLVNKVNAKAIENESSVSN